MRSRPIDCRAPAPKNRYLFARDRETNQLVLIAGGGATFEGSSMGRKGSRDFFRYGHWSFQEYWRHEREAKQSPYLTNMQWVEADTKEDAVREYNQARYYRRAN